ncbi:uncharacterized protein LOC143893772 isoform X2 [Temnothorax americanus]|uniref:uncharacterized protein LOC143893772 isoform X2 n=1 Tax=Temnothorax americanus TaxID=1964332 RepID=UPI0040688F9E
MSTKAGYVKHTEEKDRDNDAIGKIKENEKIKMQKNKNDKSDSEDEINMTDEGQKKINLRTNLKV